MKLFTVFILFFTLNDAFAADLALTERQITLLGTNDIHGGVEPEKTKNGSTGGMSFWAGVVRSIRTGLKAKYADRAGVLVLDAGDQFQGTLVSNYNEGQLVFAAMNEVGYDAVIPGNHDYDFGPIGWLDDKVNDSNADKNPRGALERLVAMAKFPLISANTFVKTDGECVYKNESRPKFLQPYTVKEAAGLRVALIGIDNTGTPSSTTPENVSDLCFRDEKEAYLEARQELEGKADVFVMIIHAGNSSNEFEVSNMVRDIAKTGPNALHAVIAGHTHFVNNTFVSGVPIIQSGAGGEAFGRVDLIWDDEKKEIIKNKTRKFAGIRLFHERCAPAAEYFCQDLAYEGVKVEPNVAIDALIAKAREEVAPLASRKLAGDTRKFSLSCAIG